MVGNKPNYKEEDILRTFLYIEDKPVSRAELVEKLELGEGTIRTILSFLKEKKLLKSNRPGHYLSKKGKEKKEELKKMIEGPKKLTLTEYKNLKSCGLLIKKPGKTKINLDLRDEAIRNGAYSSIIFQYNKELKIPFLEYNYKKENKKDYEKINEEFKLEQGNLLIITFAKEQSTCENSSLAVMKKINNMKII